jgi:SAM-dependent methyltransferase
LTSTARRGKLRTVGSVSGADIEKGGRAVSFEELKQRQSRMWGNGPYQRITETITDIHERVVERLAPEPGDRWLDLATGTGAVAERAAERGATVTGVDLAPDLIATAGERASARGLEIDYVVGDAERLEFEDGSFEKVSSTCGIMFTPDHESSARELARVTAPGGRIALANWTPTGGLAKMFAVMAPYQPAPPPSSPFAWGDRGRVEELLGESFELELEEHTSTLRIESGEAYWELFSTSYGPTKTLAESIGEQREDLRRDWIEFFETNYADDGEIVHTREYLLVHGTRR